MLVEAGEQPNNRFLIRFEPCAVSRTLPKRDAKSLIVGLGSNAQNKRREGTLIG